MFDQYPPSCRRRKGRILGLYGRIFGFIEERYRERISLRDAARAVSRSLDGPPADQRDQALSGHVDARVAG